MSIPTRAQLTEPPIWAPLDPPFLTKEQMVEVDRAMVEDYGITLIQMMENAGRHLAELGRVRFLNGDAGGRRAFVLAGSGGNGGGALVCARHLANWGADVAVFLSKRPVDFDGVPAHQLRIIEHLGLPVGGVEDLPDDAEIDLILDGLIGYSLRGAPRGPAAEMICWANRQKAPILALDTPSGLDTTTGEARPPTVCAAATLTLALPKVGFSMPEAASHIGELYLADISVPPGLYDALNLGVDVRRLFAHHPIVRLR
ncbi:MAG: NAD(P)H-hydrate epimerase [Anaerolineae bacterium]